MLTRRFKYITDEKEYLLLSFEKIYITKLKKTIKITFKYLIFY